jgi:hypothetical protein
MNLCEDRHEPAFRVVYKPAKGHSYKPEWLVCESCLENKQHFGSDDLVESVTPLTKIAV